MKWCLVACIIGTISTLCEGNNTPVSENYNGNYNNYGNVKSNKNYGSDYGYGREQQSYNNQQYSNDNQKYGAESRQYNNDLYSSNSNMYRGANYGYDNYVSYKGYSAQTPFVQETTSYGHQSNYIAPAFPDRVAPYPFIDFPKQKERVEIELPPISDYHCFLSQAPWGTCGRRSLQSYFLQQCITFYYLLSENVDGICGGIPPLPVPEPDYYRTHVAEKSSYANGYGPNNSPYDPRSEYSPSAAPVVQPKPTPAPTSVGYSDPVISEYQKECCLQKTYISITTAVVACLTENIIRIKFIEHYSTFARQNPIEGPMLYLKKLHTFIEKVLGCTQSSTVFNNYPNLWLTYKNDEGKVAYNPNSPFFVEEVDSRVGLNQYASAEAAGVQQFTVGRNGDLFLCSNPDYITTKYENRGYYHKDISNPHYDIDIINQCHTRSKKYLGNDDKGESLVLKTCQTVQGDHKVSDQTIHSLYNSVSFVQRGTSALNRPQTIAEVAVRMSGVFQQPILEGFGIFYYCAFHSCKANTQGDIDGHCLPRFEDCDAEWRIPSEVTSWSEIHKLSDLVNCCIRDRKINARKISENTLVKQYNNNLHRSYICMAEPHVVRFLKRVVTKEQVLDDALGLVYLKHLATERCYEKSKVRCSSNKSLYKDLVDALKSIVADCDAAEEKRAAAYRGYSEAAPESKGYGGEYSNQGYANRGQRASGYNSNNGYQPYSEGRRVQNPLKV